ncbi:hypothetical protein CR513_37518, partial [Mucuna pruriens]
MRTLSGQFRSIKRPNPNPKLSKSSSPTRSEIKFNDKPKPESWCVYLILATNHPIKTYVGITNNFPRRSITGNLKVVPRHPVLAGLGFVHASFVVLQTEVKNISPLMFVHLGAIFDKSPASVFESKWKAFSRRAPRKNQNDNLSKQSEEDPSLPLLRHRQAALNRVKGSLDCNPLEIIWHLDPL